MFFAPVDIVFVDTAAEAERKRCARICETMASEYAADVSQQGEEKAKACVEAMLLAAQLIREGFKP